MTQNKKNSEQIQTERRNLLSSVGNYNLLGFTLSSVPDPKLNALRLYTQCLALLQKVLFFTERFVMKMGLTRLCGDQTKPTRFWRFYREVKSSEEWAEKTHSLSETGKIRATDFLQCLSISSLYFSAWVLSYVLCALCTHYWKQGCCE